MSDILKTLKFLDVTWLHVAVAVDKQLETQAARIAELEAALQDIANGRYSNVLLPTHPPQDPAVVRARAALATARREGIKEAAQSLIEKYQSMVIRPNTPEAWRISILQDLQEMAGEKPHVITAADIDGAAIRAALEGEKKDE